MTPQRDVAFHVQHGRGYPLLRWAAASGRGQSRCGRARITGVAQHSRSIENHALVACGGRDHAAAVVESGVGLVGVVAPGARHVDRKWAVVVEVGGGGRFVVGEDHGPGHHGCRCGGAKCGLLGCLLALDRVEALAEICHLSI